MKCGSRHSDSGTIVPEFSAWINFIMVSCDIPVEVHPRRPCSWWSSWRCSQSCCSNYRALPLLPAGKQGNLQACNQSTDVQCVQWSPGQVNTQLQPWPASSWGTAQEATCGHWSSSFISSSSSLDMSTTLEYENKVSTQIGIDFDEKKYIQKHSSEAVLVALLPLLPWTWWG